MNYKTKCELFFIILKSDNSFRHATLLSPLLYLVQQAIGKEIWNKYVDERPQNIEVFHSEDVQYFKRKFEELYSTWEKNQNGFVFECKSILYKILSRIEKETSTRNLSKSNEKFHEAIEYIHENFTDKSLTVDFLADMCAMSDTYFRRLFMKNFNTTPLKYINNLKLERAKELLRSGYFTVSEVSEECGFDTVHYFCLFIKKETGLTPSQFLPQHET